MRRRRFIAERNAAVLIWVPVLLAAPVIDAGSPPVRLINVALAVVAAVSCVIAVVSSWPAPTGRATAAWAVLALSITTGSLISPVWSPAWLLVAMAAGVGFRPRWWLLTVPACAIAAAWLSMLHTGYDQSVLGLAFTVILAGATAGVLSQLVETSETLRRTRAQLAAAAVDQERDRIARDLHDVLGHTLSTMVVKAAATRRLVRTDPDAAAGHAADIEAIGRTALTSVRQAIDDTHPLDLAEELATAAATLEAAGISATLPGPGPGRCPADQPLAWAVREAVTNVVRHSQARHCHIRLTDEGGRRQLTVTDDGVGGSRPPTAGAHGLSGLRRRLELAGGTLQVQPGSEGFTLTAWVPSEGHER